MEKALKAYSKNVYKIIEANLTDDTYHIIKSDQEELMLSKPAISEWMTFFAKTGQVYIDDMEMYKYHTDLNYLREYFKTYFKEKKKEPWRLKYRRKVGNEFRWVLLEIVPTDEYSDDHQIVYFYIQDIDHQIYDPAIDANNLREQLKEYMLTSKIVHNMMNLATWFVKYDEEGNEISIRYSDQFKLLLGFEEEDRFPQKLESWKDRIHPEDIDYVLNSKAAACKDISNHTKFDVTYRIQMKDGKYRKFRSSGEFLRWSDGIPYYFTGLFVDVNDE